jgi:UDP-N-acetylmuramoylalanine--D-glutamate ligase
MEPLADKQVIVAGAGRSGLLAARLLAGEGARVTLRDDRSRADVEASLCEPIPAGIAFLRGMPGKEEVRGSALLVVSPGVPREKLPLSALAAEGVPVWGELELGFRRFRGKVAAITGTNGKSTVTTLVGGMASRAFPRVFVGGTSGRRSSPPGCSLRLGRGEVSASSSSRSEVSGPGGGASEPHRGPS